MAFGQIKVEIHQYGKKVNNTLYLQNNKLSSLAISHKSMLFLFHYIRTEAKSNCKTVFKMFFLLGMTWTLDILGWALMVYDQNNLGFKTSKIFIDLINSLQGVILLCVMYFNSANLQRMRRWFRKSRSETTFKFATT